MEMHFNDTENSPVYSKQKHEAPHGTGLWFIKVDEGWRSWILCERMYEWAADQLLERLQASPGSPAVGLCQHGLIAHNGQHLAPVPCLDAPLSAEQLLTAHLKRSIEACDCGWAELGRSHTAHVADMLRQAGLLA